jgi:hypothetical protein
MRSLNRRISNWPALLQKPFVGAPEILSLRRSARRRFTAAAEQFVLRLSRIAQQAGLGQLTNSVLTGDSDSDAIVMTGHQPVIFHSGLTYKYGMTERFARESGCICAAIIVDTDEGDAGHFVYPSLELNAASTNAVWPTPDNNSPANDRELHVTRLSASVAAASSLYLYAALKSSDELRLLENDICTALQALQLNASVEHARRTLRHYIQLSDAGVPASEASVISRWYAGIGAGCLELPLSAFSCFPEAELLMLSVINRAAEFAVLFNQRLQEFRLSHGIDNRANPFPDLETGPSASELPFWVLDHLSRNRTALRVVTAGDDIELLAGQVSLHRASAGLTENDLSALRERGLQIVPRGSMITAFLRLLCADLFVHGTGGGKYDQFTDDLISSFWKCDPPTYCVSSASRYLLSEERTDLQRLEDSEATLRDLQFNPQRYFGTRAFSSSLEAKLQILCERKQQLVAEMQAARRANQPSKDTGRRIQELTEQIRLAVSGECEAGIQRLHSLTPENITAIQCRTYPWFFFQ